MVNESSPIPENQTPTAVDSTSGEHDETLDVQVQGMRKELTYLTHQVYRMLLALHVPPCVCANCTQQHQHQNELILKSTLANGLCQNMLNGAAGATSTTKPEVNGGGCSNHDMSSDSGHSLNENEAAAATDVNFSNNDGMESVSMVSSAATPFTASSVITANSFNEFNQSTSPTVSNGNGQMPNRKSKYTTMNDKITIATYAASHGATAAAKKYGIPPSVAAYYHRKIFNRHLPKGRRPSFGGMPSVEQSFDSLCQQLVHKSSTDSTVNASPSSSLNNNNNNGNINMSNNNNSMALPPRTSSMTSNCYGMVRGRGRPKLIGDELDAKFITHLVTLIEAGEHLSSEKVLVMARAYVGQHSPGLLDFQGGSVNLKPAWAIGALRRANEEVRNRRFGPEGAPSLLNGSHPNLSMVNGNVSDLSGMDRQLSTSTNEEVMAMDALIGEANNHNNNNSGNNYNNNTVNDSASSLFGDYNNYGETKFVPTENLGVFGAPALTID